uniref:Uncharacterized protein n=1 Tax=Oryza brachyantha TaxID=4533 RepID=J3LQB2_ORYBR
MPRRKFCLFHTTAPEICKINLLRYHNPKYALIPAWSSWVAPQPEITQANNEVIVECIS